MQPNIPKNFNPSLSSPYYFIRKFLLKKIAEYSKHLQGNLLDFGCGTKPYKSLFNHVNSYTGIDFENPGHSHANEQIDVFYDGKKIPFADNEFDSVLSSEVFEHIFNLEEVVVELHRVLKPGGKMLITCPFVWNEHEVPHDYARYTQFALKNLLERNGFKVLIADKSGDFATTLHQMKMVYISEHFLQSIFIIGKLKFITSNIRSPLMFLCNGTFLLCHKLLPKRKDLYLNNIFIVEKVSTIK